MAKSKLTLTQQIEANTVPEPNSGCVLWTGSGANRYPRICRGTGAGMVCWGVHRLVWQMAHGPIYTGMFVCHHCDTPNCVNIDHLFLGSHTDNMRDMRTKGRQNYVMAERQRAVTHCPRGHPYSPENTRIGARGGRLCRACGREGVRARTRRLCALAS